MQFLEHIFLKDIRSLYQPTRLHHRKWTAETPNPSGLVQMIFSLQFGDFVSSILIFRGFLFGRPKKVPPFKTTTGLKCFSAEELRLEAVLEALAGWLVLASLRNCCSPETEHDKGKATIKTDEFPLPC